MIRQLLIFKNAFSILQKHFRIRLNRLKLVLYSPWKCLHCNPAGLAFVKAERIMIDSLSLVCCCMLIFPPKQWREYKKQQSYLEAFISVINACKQ